MVFWKKNSLLNIFYLDVNIVSGKVVFYTLNFLSLLLPKFFSHIFLENREAFYSVNVNWFCCLRTNFLKNYRRYIITSWCWGRFFCLACLDYSRELFSRNKACSNAIWLESIFLILLFSIENWECDDVCSSIAYKYIVYVFHLIVVRLNYTALKSPE